MPQGRGGSTCSCGAGATRAELCGSLPALEREKAELRRVTLRQCQELDQLDRDCKALRAVAADADVARAGFAAGSCADWCASDITRIELEQLQAERRRLEQELVAWHDNADRLRTVHQSEAQHTVERGAWDAERRMLEQTLAGAQAHLNALESGLDRQASEASSGLVHLESTVRSLRQDLAEQRRLRGEAEAQMRAAQAELATIRTRQRPGSPPREEWRQVEAQRSKLHEVREQASREGDVRRRNNDNMQASIAELEELRREIPVLVGDNVQLRANLQRTLQTLENIRQTSAGAEAFAAALFPRAEPPDRRGRGARGRPSESGFA